MKHSERCGQFTRSAKNQIYGLILNKPQHKGQTMNTLNTKYLAHILILTAALMLSAASAHCAIGETGKVSAKHQFPDKWQSVSFKNIYRSPVVFAGPVSANGPDPAHIRIKDLTGTGFKYRVEEWSYLNDEHTEEQFSYIAVEKGVHNLGGGIIIEAGDFKTDATFGRGKWASVTLSDNWRSAPAIFAQVLSFNGPDPVSSFIKNKSINHFSYTMKEDGAKNDIHTTERIGYIAVSQGFFTLGGSVTAVKCPPESITHKLQNIRFATAGLTTAPAFIAFQQTTNGTDTFTLRYKNLSSSSVDIFIEEEQGADEETMHTQENFCLIIAE